MASKWFKVGNKTEIEAPALTEQSSTVFLEGIGPKTVYFFCANEIGVMIDGVYMIPNQGGKDITVTDNRALWIDPETLDIYVGIEDGT